MMVAHIRPCAIYPHGSECALEKRQPVSPHGDHDNDGDSLLQLSLSPCLLSVGEAEEQSKGLEFIMRDFPLDGAQQPENVASSHNSQRCHIIFVHLHPRHRDLACLERVCLSYLFPFSTGN